MLSRVVPDQSVRATAAADAALADAWRALWISRLLVWAAAVVALALFGLSERVEDFDPRGLTTPFGPTGDLLAAPLGRWDSVWFLQIAADGYGDGARTAFFPLYPLLVRLAGAPFGSGLIGGALLSTVLLAVALVLLHRLVALDHDRAVARNAVLVTALFPMSFFFSAVYSESLFLALSIGAVYAARRERWAWAGLLGMLAAMTRSAGVLLLVPLAMIYLWDVARPSLATRRPLRPDALWLALVPLGLASFCALLALGGHDPLAPFRAQEVWFRSFAGPFAGAWDGLVGAWQGARQLLSGGREPIYFTAAGGDPFVAARHNVELFAWLVLALAATAGVLRRLPAAYGAYVVAALALPLSYPVAPQPLMSLPRFVAVLFPLAIWLALWMTGRAARERLVLAAFAVALAVYTAIFATWQWVA
ncbi:MAG TPA: mannosyltransferase family protein [Solirubrobacteraceae bacterium]|nr:mannosyltransferase family protein [Solirubrobacteraceae bacterium]